MVLDCEKRALNLIHFRIKKIFAAFFQNSLDNTTFSKVMELLEPPSFQFKTIKSRFIHLLHGAKIWISSKWNIVRTKEDYVIAKNTELYGNSDK